MGLGGAVAVRGDGEALEGRLDDHGWGAPAAKGVDIAEGTTGVKSPPSATSAGAKAAFGWAEVMGPSVSTKRILLRILNAACIP